MYEEDKLSTDDAIKQANDFAEQGRIEASQRQAETMIKMQENQEQHNKLKELAQALGIQNMQHEIDDIKTVMTKQDESLHYLADRMNDMIKAINNVSASIQGQATPDVANQGTVTTAGSQPHLQTLLGILDSPLGEKLFSRLFPEQAAPSLGPLISPEIINQKMTQSFMDDLETGESIRKFISDTLKKKATQTIVKQSLGNLGAPSVHEPE